MTINGFGTSDLRRLGETGILVSPIGLGTVKFGRNQGVKYPEKFALPDDETLSRLLSTAQALGVNLIDTAPAYGESEARLGKLLLNRKDWIIGSKVGETFLNGQSSWDFSEIATRKSIEESLKRLGTDYLDYILVHSNGDDETIVLETEVLSTLAKVKEAGLIRAFGVSTKTLTGGLLTLAHSDIAMVTYNVSETNDLPVIERAEEMHKGVLVKKALESGHSQTPKGALRFALEPKGVTSVIVGTINTDHLEQNVSALTST